MGSGFLIMKLTAAFVTLLGSYYLFFLNKGIALTDEGYFVTPSWLINAGLQPYSDFFYQYPPLFPYSLALIFKFFGTSLVISRTTALVVYLSSFLLSIKIMNKFGLSKASHQILAFLVFASLGFPLSNIASPVTWVVFETLLLMPALLSQKSPWLIGLILASLLSTKQNVGLTLAIATNLYYYISLPKNRALCVSLFILNSSLLSICLVWIYYLFLRTSHLNQFFYFLSFGARLFTIYPPSYPPLTFLTQLTGFFKLLPYYFPIIIGVIIGFSYLKSHHPKLLVLLLPFVGFFTNLLPQSDLLHVYPFLPLVLVSSYIFTHQYLSHKISKLVTTVLIFIIILEGFFLTFHGNYYRYFPPYSAQNQLLLPPRAGFIQTDRFMAKNLNLLHTYFSSHSEISSVFIYPFSPALYFLLDLFPITPHLILWPGYLTLQEEQLLVNQLSNGPPTFIIAEENISFGTPLSKWITSHTPLAHLGSYLIYTTP